MYLHPVNFDILWICFHSIKNMLWLFLGFLLWLRLFRNLLFNFQTSVMDSPDLFLLMISNKKLLRSVYAMGFQVFQILKLVLWHSKWSITDNNPCACDKNVFYNHCSIHVMSELIDSVVQVLSISLLIFYQLSWIGYWSLHFLLEYLFFLQFNRTLLHMFWSCY